MGFRFGLFGRGQAMEGAGRDGFETEFLAVVAEPSAPRPGLALPPLMLG